MLSVRELCQLKGVTRKTLYYYDKIGLLKPTKRVGKQKAEVYSQNAADRLDEIICLQNAGLTLSEIREMIDRPVSEKAEKLGISIMRMQEERKELDRRIEAAVELMKGMQEM